MSIPFFNWISGLDSKRPVAVLLTGDEQDRLYRLLDRIGYLQDVPDRDSTSDMMKLPPTSPRKVYAFKLLTNDYWDVTEEESRTLQEALMAYSGVDYMTPESEAIRLEEALENLSTPEWEEKVQELIQFCKIAAEHGGFQVQ